MKRKKIIRIVFSIVGALLFMVAITFAYLRYALPNVGAAPAIQIERTPARVLRGKYLVNNVVACMDCHSERDFSRLAGPFFAGPKGAGGVRFDRKFGFPGVFYTKNITPYGLGKWTDGEIYRAITSGVDRHGKTLFPAMPYLNYGKMETEDVYAIIAYIRTLQSVPNDLPPSEIDFPASLFLNLVPTKASPAAHVDRSDTVAYGHYLVVAAGCADCHTPQREGKDAGDPFSGGNSFPIPSGGLSRPANITPDKATGIGNWTAAFFVQRFKMYADSAVYNLPVQHGQFNTVMPWTIFAGMDTSDLRAIYAYLRTVKPSRHVVEKFTP